jgi:5'-3' exonuclease
MFGFTNTLLDVLKKEKPTHIAVVFDTSAPTHRHDAFEQYKAHREEMPEDLRKSIPYIKEIIRCFNIPVIELDGYEAFLHLTLGLQIRKMTQDHPKKLFLLDAFALVYRAYFLSVPTIE